MIVPKKEIKQRRFHQWLKCSKCGRIQVRDRSLADCYLVVLVGDRKCEHNLEKSTKKEVMKIVSS